MKKIGEGWYYDVFDLEDNRVQKKRKTFKSIASKFSKGYIISTFLSWFSGYNYAVRCAWTTGRMKERIKNSDELKKLLGNPVFIGDVDYEQDKVDIVISVLSNSIEENKIIIDKYILNIIDCWKNGFADQIFNFTINNGINEWGEIILIDFNEVTFSKQNVLRDVISKRWKKSWSLTHLDQESKRYYFEQMDLSITKESLDKYWRNFYSR